MNKTHPKISIIIPVYNTEKYLSNCLDSVVNQTFSDIEIICVDDGSTDGSFAILKEYAKKDNRVTVLKQKNKRQGAARNAGLKIAKAPYIFFVDSDDSVDLDACRLLYDAMITQKCDIVINNMSTQTNDENLETRKDSYQQYYDITSYPQGIYDNDINIMKWRTSPAAKLYKKEIIDAHKITFPEKLIQEDEAWHWFYFTNVKTIYYLPVSLYNRFVHADSTMQLRDSNYERASDFAYIIEKIYKYLVKNDLYKKYSPEFQRYLKSHSLNILRRCDKQHYSKAYKPLHKLSKKAGIPLPMPAPESSPIINFLGMFFMFLLFPWHIYKTYKTLSKEVKP